MEKMGRPQFKSTAAQRRRVSICAGGGMSHEEIAIGLGIAKMTLQKYFAYELSEGAYRRRQDIIEAMYRTAKKGNVAAQKAYVALGPQIAAPPQPKDAEKPQGKKEQAAADAVTAQTGTEWADLLPSGPAQ